MAQKKTGTQYLAKLPADVQAKFIVNLVNGARTADKISRRLTDEYTSLHEFVFCAFVWYWTPEGPDYWSSVCVGIRPEHDGRT